MEAAFVDAAVPTPPRATLSLKPALKKRSALATPAPPAPSSSTSAAATVPRPRKLAFAEASSQTGESSWETQQSLRANALSAIRQALGNGDAAAAGSSSQAESAPAGSSSANTNGPTLLASTAVMLAEAQRQEEREAKRRRKEEKRAAKEKRKLEGEEGEGGQSVKKAKVDDEDKEEKKRKKEKKKADKEKAKEDEKASKKERKKEEKDRRKSAPASAAASGTDKPKKEKKRRASAVEKVVQPASSPEPADSSTLPPPESERKKRKRPSPPAASETPVIPTSASVLAKFMAQAQVAEESRQQQEAADRAARDLAALAEREAEEHAAKEKAAKAARKAQEKRKAAAEPDMGAATLAAVIAGTAASAEAASAMAVSESLPVKKAVKRTRVPKTPATPAAGPSDEAGPSSQPDTPVDAATLKKQTASQRRETLRDARNERKAAEFSTPEFRSRLQNPTELHEFLAGSWIEIPVLQRLEADGVITYKRGKFTEAEKDAVRDHLETFKRIHGLSHSQLIDIMISKGRSAERGPYPNFWSQVAAQVPGRPVRYVKEAVIRIYHPSAHKGKWTAEEDRALLQAYELNPGGWGPISESVGRTMTDCRDRWRGQLRDAAGRKTGAWSDDEVEALTNAINTAMTQLGADMLDTEVPWEVVLDLMGRTRTLTQCRKKWTESIAPKLRGAANKVNRRIMVAAIRKLGYQNPKDIQWNEVADELGVVRSPLSARWLSMLRLVWPDGLAGVEKEGVSMTEILDRVDEALAERERLIAANGGKVPRTLLASKSRAYIDDSDEDDYLVPHKVGEKVMQLAKDTAPAQEIDPALEGVAAPAPTTANVTVAEDADTMFEEMALAAEEGGDGDEDEE